MDFFLGKIYELTPNLSKGKKFAIKHVASLTSTKKIINETKSITKVELQEYSLLYLVINNLIFFKENINLIENIKLFTKENKIVFDAILSKLKTEQKPSVKNLEIDTQLIDKIIKFASIKHIFKNDQNRIIELVEEFVHGFKIHSLEARIEELESKFSKDMSETTFNEIKNLKEQKKKENIN